MRRGEVDVIAFVFAISAAFSGAVGNPSLRHTQNTEQCINLFVITLKATFTIFKTSRNGSMQSTAKDV